jgi:hypothetical protein
MRSYHDEPEPTPAERSPRLRAAFWITYVIATVVVYVDVFHWRP